MLEGWRKICQGNLDSYVHPRPLTRIHDMAEVPEEEIKHVQVEIGELVKRALVQAGDLQDVEEKLKQIVERSSKMTPPPAESPGA